VSSVGRTVVPALADEAAAGFGAGLVWRVGVV
jgi:hypothetical protein